MKLAIVGVTGLVGRKMLEILEQKDIKVEALFPVASEKSTGNRILFKNKEYKVISINDLIDKKPEIALFSAGSQVSKEWAPQLAEIGCRVIDNSSYWRMRHKHKLIVPEINFNDLNLSSTTVSSSDMIIANPNCSTIQLVIAISEIHKKFKIKRMIVSTYQAVSGSGKKAINQLHNESKSISTKKVYERQIFNNIIPQCDIFDEDQYTKEEYKIINETNKILNSKIRITATAVRVPIENSHSESVNIELVNNTTTEELIQVLKQTKGVQYMGRANNYYSTPNEATGSDLVYVGRVRRDFSKNNCFNLWVVSDNLRKGAATNAIQILEKIINK